MRADRSCLGQPSTLPFSAPKVGGSGQDRQKAMAPPRARQQAVCRPNADIRWLRRLLVMPTNLELARDTLTNVGRCALAPARMFAAWRAALACI